MIYKKEGKVLEVLPTPNITLENVKDSNYWDLFLPIFKELSIKEVKSDRIVFKSNSNYIIIIYRKSVEYSVAIYIYFTGEISISGIVYKTLKGIEKKNSSKAIEWMLENGFLAIESSTSRQKANQLKLDEAFRLKKQATELEISVAEDYEEEILKFCREGKEKEAGELLREVDWHESPFKFTFITLLSMYFPQTTKKDD